ncbi:MAG: nitrate reductase molybdenum cofactor assembly chaperone [Actinomycetota bacterium]|nr:nitrate reductase molybdenum cofactor assembly chaperone [Actinomycetota bacterium]
MRRRPAQVVFGCAAVLLGYPSEEFVADLHAVRDALDGLPSGRSKSGLAATLAKLEQMGQMTASGSYVETFDLERRRSLHLTYFRHGDTRERGMALAELASHYRAAGYRPPERELADFLPALLELAAVSEVGVDLLVRHGGALWALETELAKASSHYTATVSAVREALGSPTKADRESLSRWRAQGAPSEQVGLEPYGPPEVTEDTVMGETVPGAAARR